MEIVSFIEIVCGLTDFNYEGKGLLFDCFNVLLMKYLNMRKKQHLHHLALCFPVNKTHIYPITKTYLYKSTYFR